MSTLITLVVLMITCLALFTTWAVVRSLKPRYYNLSRRKDGWSVTRKFCGRVRIYNTDHGAINWISPDGHALKHREGDFLYGRVQCRKLQLKKWRDPS